MIEIVGLGPGSYESLTVGTLNELKKGKNIFLRTEKHPTVEYLKKENIKFTTYDSIYNTKDSFDDVYSSIAKDVIEKHQIYGDVIYAVPGHPLVAERSVSILMDLCKKNNIEYKILPAVSFIDAVMESLKIDPIEGLKIIDAFDIRNQILDKRIGTIVTQVYSTLIASEVKLALLDQYDDETEIYFVRAAGIKNEESIRKIKLYELDMQHDIDYLTSIYIPKDVNNKKDFNDLLELVEILRGENGCPWDKKQTHDSIKKAVIEESYEVKDAIDNKDYDALIEELGDVLFQVVFHSSIGKEDGYFNISDVIKGIYEKMVLRHPHVFANEKDVDSVNKVLVKWDEIKKDEKGFNTLKDELNGVAKALPALLRAYKVQKKIKRDGLYLENIDKILEKVKENLNEIFDEYKMNNMDIIEDKIGSLLFLCVNLSGFLNIDAEEVLNAEIDRFIERVGAAEDECSKKCINMKDMSSEEIDKIWLYSKKQ
ncbi:nucleoside triphosphate pyrophosphohydrolase [Clostridium sp. BJN0001]|uniref:nucleoside triphosphate pyrophosphohydrolase n=1 Tax=Clostridium sp. BJN0001 TaxID=2930219 RepID=UPI001FD112BB|nr:nucleoside triphosphate pyrophosphohydrolase [Clostridium sp. BJN0001]